MDGQDNRKNREILLGDCKIGGKLTKEKNVKK